MSKLDNFTETCYVDNMKRFLPLDKEDEIIIGGNATHIFKLNFNYFELVQECIIIYKQGLDTVLVKKPVLENIETFGDHSVVTLELTPVDTTKFKKSMLDTFVQMKIINKAGETLYNEPNKLVVKEPLDQ